MGKKKTRPNGISARIVICARKRMGGKKCYVESILVSNKGGGRNLCYDGGSRNKSN